MTFPLAPAVTSDPLFKRTLCFFLKRGLSSKCLNRASRVTPFTDPRGSDEAAQPLASAGPGVVAGSPGWPVAAGLSSQRGCAGGAYLSHSLWKGDGLTIGLGCPESPSGQL